MSVLAVSVVVAGLVASCSSSTVERRDPSACKRSRLTTLAAVEGYFARNGQYPAHVGDLKTEGFVADIENAVGDMINGPAKDDGSPEWALTYRAEADGSGFGLDITVAPSDGC